MSDWFDSEDPETPETGEGGKFKRRKPINLEIGGVRPPPRSPLLINPDGTDKVFDVGHHDDLIKHEKEMNKRRRSLFDELSDQDLSPDHEPRGEAPDEERSE